MAFTRPPRPPRRVDDDVVEVTRTSDTQKKFGGRSAGSGSFGSKKNAADPDHITRTSDRKSLYKPRPAPGTPREKPAQSCKAYAGWLLSRRDYSAAVLRNKLILRGYDAAEADEALAFLVAHGFQSDARYAHSLALSLARRAGDRRLLMTMQQKQVDAALSAAQLGQIAPESERVLQVVEKFKKDVAAGGLDAKLQQKIYRFLAYRGFSGASIKLALKFLAEQDAPD